MGANADGLQKLVGDFFGNRMTGVFVSYFTRTKGSKDFSISQKMAEEKKEQE